MDMLHETFSVNGYDKKTNTFSPCLDSGKHNLKNSKDYVKFKTLLHYKAWFKNGSNMLWSKSRRKVYANIVLIVIILLFVIVMVGT